MSAPIPYPITGIQTGLGPGSQVPVRPEVDAWSNDPENLTQVNLFILALSFFQNQTASETLSYFQIAGIHGMPYIAWNEKKAPVNVTGYCTHNSILFPSWHRPYVALFEQRLHEIMIQEIIPKYPRAQQPDLVNAANAWRLPYWDWAVTNALPEIATKRTYTVNTFDGQTTDIANPLYQFTMPGGKTMGTGGVRRLVTQTGRVLPYDTCRTTSRCPPPSSETAVWVNGVQNNNQVNINLESTIAGGATLREAVYRLFTYPADYETFATTAMNPRPSPTQYLNCEAIHNSIHGEIGGRYTGHMGVPAVAAFDPIFWLHHCNIDRQYAIWQTIFDDQWFDDPKVPLRDEGTFSIPKENRDTPKTKLAPFRDTQGNYYDSNDARSWLDFGYSYPELQPWLPKYNPGGQFDKAIYINGVNKQINSLYGQTRHTFLRRTVAQPAAADVDQTPLVGAAQASAVAIPTQTVNEVETPGVKHDDYVINVRYEKYALQGEPYKVKFYLDQTPQDPESGYIGSVYNFSSPLPENPEEPGCDNCKAQKELGIVSTGQVPITSVLLDHIQDQQKPLWSLHNDPVQTYLTEHLRWKVTQYGEEVPLTSISGLKVSIAAGTVSHYDDSRALSEYGGYRVLYPVTSGREGGLAHGEEY